MADTPDDLLARARQMRDTWLDAPDRSDAEFEGAQDMYRAFYDLDRLLSAGGPLPAAWADCAPVVNVVSHMPDIVDLPDGNQVFAPPPRTVPLDAHVRKLAERDAEIARLTAELDAARNVPVEYVITAGLEAAMAVDPHREDGTVLRVTDGKREAWAWKAAAREWEQIR